MRPDGIIKKYVQELRNMKTLVKHCGNTITTSSLFILQTNMQELRCVWTHVFFIYILLNCHAPGVVSMMLKVYWLLRVASEISDGTYPGLGDSDDSAAGHTGPSGGAAGGDSSPADSSATSSSSLSSDKQVRSMLFCWVQIHKQPCLIS